jgi:hypothetical protein
MIYNSIEEIPYRKLRNGGTFEVRTENLPQGIYRKGGAVAVSVSNPIPFIIAFAYILLGTICTVVIISHLGTLVSRIKAVPEGKVMGETEDGSKIWNSADGSSWILSADGTAKQLGGGVAMDWNLVIYAVIFFAIIILAWRFLPPLIGKAKKVKLETVSTYRKLKNKKEK